MQDMTDPFIRASNIRCSSSGVEKGLDDLTPLTGAGDLTTGPEGSVASAGACKARSSDRDSDVPIAKPTAGESAQLELTEARLSSAHLEQGS